MDGVWIDPMGAADEGADPEGAPRDASEPVSSYLLAFFEPHLHLGFLERRPLGKRFRALGRVYAATDEVVDFDWLFSPEGRLVGIRNQFVPRSVQEEAGGYVTFEGPHMQLWLAGPQEVRPGPSVHICVFAEHFAAEDGRSAMAYDVYDLKPEEIERLRRCEARWVDVEPL